MKRHTTRKTKNKSNQYEDILKDTLREKQTQNAISMKTWKDTPQEKNTKNAISMKTYEKTHYKKKTKKFNQYEDIWKDTLKEREECNQYEDIWKDTLQEKLKMQSVWRHMKRHTTRKTKKMK